jgi:hypothetical protein
MQHRHITTSQWTPLAVESLFDRGQLGDWRQFVQVMKQDARVGATALRIAAQHEDRGSAALARMLVARSHPRLLPDSTT